MYGFSKESFKEAVKETVFRDTYTNRDIGSCSSAVYRSIKAKADKAGNILIDRSVLVYD